MAPHRVFVFPGQGSQHVGMGRDAIAHRPCVGQALQRVQDLTGHDIAGAMVSGPAARLRDTVLAQLSVFALSTSLTESLRRIGIQPAAVAGHSVGEYSALVAGGWLDVESATVLVARRAEAMARCCAQSPGAMAALIGLEEQAAVALVTQVAGTVRVVGINGPRQIVISGAADAVAAAGDHAMDAGASAVVGLDVAGAFHSPLMQRAEDELAPLIADLPLRLGHTPLVSSITGAPVTDVGAYRAALTSQITAPVRWFDAARHLAGLPTDGFLEVGPGEVLRGLIRKADRRASVLQCADSADLNSLGAACGWHEARLIA